ncbi:MAG: TIGR02996 domain-containing protein [Myxococcaceae bacterium]|nr:TIGR02996 domain-containing protein [Myxococcaceae bacterium]
MSDEVRQEELQRAIEAAPDDPSRYAVYGDWLAQRGDVRGELIALQLVPNPDRRQRERVKALLMENGIRCLAGPLAQWRWGFVHTAALLRPPGPAGRSIELTKLLRHPSMRFVRALTLGQEPVRETLRELGVAAPRVLSALTLYSPRPLELGLVPDTLPCLEQLHLSLPEASGALPLLPALRSLELSFFEWTTRSREQLFGANGPRLRRFKLAVQGELAASVLLDVLSAGSLETLVIEASELGVDAVSALSSAPGAQHLVTLDLSRSGLTERAARQALELSRHLPRLSSLVLGDAVES